MYRLACSLCKLYMVCNSLQGMDGLAAWGTRLGEWVGHGLCDPGSYLGYWVAVEIRGVPYLIQDHTFGTNVQYTLGILHGYTIYPCLHLVAIPTSGTPHFSQPFSQTHRA
ncbi:hypothetical protein B0H13DRAFT_1927253 [Mycena leptocephala]|nr:hypothetical protein B0H13DRAFT_1927253 [Mycena leptocephala]